MLKQVVNLIVMHKIVQPPSGGCVLKRQIEDNKLDNPEPAAFRRLCVET